MTVDFAFWNALVSTLTLLVIAATAFVGLRQVRHLRGQNTLSALLKVLDDWRDPEFVEWREYLRVELPERLKDPAYLDAFDAMSLSRERHPELHVCDWYEQLGSYVKFGLLDEHAVMDVAGSTTPGIWAAVEPIVERMRRRRGPAAYENFEYMVVRAILYARAHPNGTYPATTPRLRELRARDAAEAAAAVPAAVSDTRTAS